MHHSAEVAGTIADILVIDDGSLTDIPLRPGHGEHLCVIAKRGRRRKNLL